MKRIPPNIQFNRLPFIYLLGILIGGIVTGYYLSNLSNRNVFFLFLIILGITIYLFFAHHQKSSKLLSLFLLCDLFLIGMLLCKQVQVRTHPHWYGHSIQQATDFYGQITQTPEPKPKTLKLLVSVNKVRIDKQWKKASGKLLLYLYRQDSMPTIHKGDRILLPNQLQRINNRGNPFEFDYAAYLEKKGIYYQAFLSPDVVFISRGSRTKANFLDHLHHQLLGSLQRNIRDTVTASLTEATLLNERTMLDNEIWRAYSVTGIAHIIAISGMHVSLFFSIILALLWWLKAPGLKWIKYLLGLPIVWAYVAITGFPPSAVRAAVMFSIVFVCLFLRKDHNPLNFLAATGFILLCYNPLWLFDTGIQLSFSAVASIFLFFKPIQKLWQPHNKIALALWNVICVSLSVQILVFPIVLYYFHQFPVWFLFSNIPASLFSFLLMAMGLLIFLLDAFGIPCIWLGNLMGAMTLQFHRLIFFLANHTPATMRHLYLTTTSFWLLLTIIILFCIFLFFRKKIFIYAALALSCLLSCVSILHDFQAEEQQRIIVYNSSGYSLIDYLNGRKCYSLSQNHLNEIQEAYTYLLLPSRLGFNVRNPAETHATAPLKIIEGKKILVLQQNLRKTPPRPFPVDYLVINNHLKLVPKLWDSIFKPKEVILDGSFPRWQAKQWQEILSKQGFTVYNVHQKGAWQFPK